MKEIAPYKNKLSSPVPSFKSIYQWSDEFLAEAVRKYSIIYDKKKKGHKDKMMVENAWKKVAEEVGLESSEIAKRLRYFF